MLVAFVTIGIIGWAIFWVAAFIGLFRFVFRPTPAEGETAPQRPWYSKSRWYMLLGLLAGICVFYPLFLAAASVHVD